MATATAIPASLLRILSAREVRAGVMILTRVATTTTHAGLITILIYLVITRSATGRDTFQVHRIRMAGAGAAAIARHQAACAAITLRITKTERAATAI